MTEVWHLAAVYDLAVAPRGRAPGQRRGHRQRARSSAASSPTLRRLQYVSTCYVSGRHEGEFAEDALEVGQAFRNHYEQTKYDAELLVRKAWPTACPPPSTAPASSWATRSHRRHPEVRRPLLPRHLPARQPAVAVVPAVGDADRVRVCLVPARLRGRCDGRAVGARRVGRPHLRPRRPRPADRPRGRRRPSPGTAAPGSSGCRSRCAPCTPSSSTCPAWSGCSGLPAEALDYFASPDDVRDGEHDPRPHGIRPGLPALLDLRRPPARLHEAHPEYDANAMT